MNPKLSIVIPCYNESGNLPLIVARLRELLHGRDDTEVVLVNNGSTDDSAETFSKVLADPALAFIRVEHVKGNRGYGFGIMSGLRAARGEFLAWTHADMQTDPADVLKGLETILTSRDPQNVYLKGRRIARNPLDAFFTFGMSVVSSACLGLWLNDINAQPKMFSRRFFEMFEAPPDDFAFEVYVYYLARKRGLELLTIPVSFANRRHGQAKGGGTLAGKWKLTRRTLLYIIRLRRDLRKAVR
jgi:glycosyltransferase involved in cell wall biosynthesis